VIALRIREQQDTLIEGKAGDGNERKAHGEKTGNQVSQPAKKVAERESPVKTGQEEVRMSQPPCRNRPRSRLFLGHSLDQPQVEVTFGTSSLHAFGNGWLKALVEPVGIVSQRLGLVGLVNLQG